MITNALLKSVASKAKSSVADSEERRLYDICSQLLDVKRSVAAQVSLLFPLHSHAHAKCVTRGTYMNFYLSHFMRWIQRAKEQPCLII